MDIDQQAADPPDSPRKDARAAVDAIEAKLDEQYPDRSVPDEARSASVEDDEPGDVTRTDDPEPPD